MENSRNIEFILLHSTKYGEKSLVLHTLSREYGRCSLFLRSVTSGGKASGGKSRTANLLSPLNIIEASVPDSNSKGSLITVNGLATAYPLTCLRSDLYKNCISIFIAELLFRALKDGAHEAGLYDWCVQKILLLDAIEGNFSNFHLLFTLELSAALGFRPEYRDIEDFIELPHRGLVKELLSLPFSEALLLPMNGSVRSSIVESLIRYLETHLEYPLNIRSTAILKEIM